MNKERGRGPAGAGLAVAGLLAAALFTGIPGRAAAQAEVPAGIDFSIRFFDRQIYYDGGDPIPVQLTIANTGTSTFRFKLADSRAFSVDFEVRTANNRLVEPSELLVRRRTQSGQVFFRELTIEPGESFSIVENLRDYVQMQGSGAFIVRAFIHPELFRPTPFATAASARISPQGFPEGALASGRLNLNVRPAPLVADAPLPLAMELATGAILSRERLPPDEVIEYMIRARQRSQWERFFLYLDLDQMLARDPVRSRLWTAESEEGRQRMVEQFRTELMNPADPSSISVIPTDFTIERTQHSGEEGTVTVMMRFAGLHFTELRRYTYFLQRRDGVWTVVDYSVVNMGTE
ncbi:MAG: hypothetical protein FWD94_06570 [Treponema sp.]|nr:hypothetical protein [Treponema sp.]